ncbi:Uncharacterised protein [Serratia odorifera]|uniref:Uncharacterized protein n=3 Tax=Serratia odorifera TaxID=618 RepID=D4E9X9_SEROD|nr:hypothetical protein HMPREF0758_4979 [Serratia odorifera DSM 4582]RII74064.1 hypothetical protein DX901_00465 [Serratia odorifera]VDZ51340.1 Uncharacterised protein [Serratia odorifera]
MKTGNLLIDVYGMKPDEEYNSLSNRKRYVVNQIIRQLLNKKRAYHDIKTNKYYFYNKADPSRYISNIDWGDVKQERYDKLYRVAKIESDKLLKNNDFFDALAREVKEKDERIKNKKQEAASAKEAENKIIKDRGWLGFSTIWAMNSGFKKIQERSSETVVAKKLVDKLVSLNSGDTHWKTGPYGTDIINAVYELDGLSYNKVGNELESYLSENSDYSSGLLYRGTTKDEFSKWMNGVYIAQRFVPTSHVVSNTEDFGKYIIEIHGGYGKNVRNIYQNKNEAEFLINRGSTFEFISEEGGNKIRVRQII